VRAERARALLAKMGIVACLLGCGPSMAQLQARERCYEAAEAEAQRKVDELCPGKFAECSDATPILLELQARQELCK
jgi:hypothetical protein